MHIQTPEPVELFLYQFVWFIVVPGIGIGFIVSIVWPGHRPDVSDILIKGLFMFIALAGTYFLGIYLRSRR